MAKAWQNAERAEKSPVIPGIYCDPSGIRTLYPGNMKTSIAARPCADSGVILRSSNIPRGTVLNRGDPSRSLPWWQGRGKRLGPPALTAGASRSQTIALSSKHVDRSGLERPGPPR